MTEKKDVRKKLAEQVDVNKMLEDTIYALCFTLGLSEEDAEFLYDNVINEHDIEELYWKSFKEQFKRKDSIERYIELQKKAVAAQDAFFEFLEKTIIEGITKMATNIKVEGSMTVH